MTDPITNSEDVIDTRDLTARIEELESTQEALLQDLEDAKETLAKTPNDLHEVMFGQASQAWLDFAEEATELALLLQVQAQAEHSPDYLHGEQLIADSYFVEYTEQLINDCYEMPKDLQSGNWPWRHMAIDYAQAAEELKQDYTDVDFDGTTYWIRA